MAANCTPSYSYSVDRWSGFFTFLGYGVMWKDTRVRGLCFSERNGIHPDFWIGKYYFRLMRP